MLCWPRQRRGNSIRFSSSYQDFNSSLSHPLVAMIAEYHIENGYSVEQIPGILARTVLDWDEMCKTRGETPEES